MNLVRFGGQSATAPLERVLVRPPDEAFGLADPDRWHYSSRPVLNAARQEHAQLVKVLRDLDIEVILHDGVLPDLADSIFVYDPVLLTNQGAVLLRMGKVLRRGEETALGKRLESLGIPILGSIESPGTAEGGDLLWLDSSTLAAGLGFRTNREGIAQLSRMLGPQGIRVVSFDLPCFQGPDSCLHLLSLVSMISSDLAVVYKPLLPTALWQELQARSIRCITVEDDEFASMGTNILSLGRGRCLMLEGNSGVQAALEEAGCDVSTYRGNEISLKAEGGPTCLTCPIHRCSE